MSKNNSYSKNKKSQSTKPYNVANSFVRRLSVRVSEYIPQSLRIGSWFGHSDAAPEGEDDHAAAADCYDEATEAEEERGLVGDVTREAQSQHRHLGSHSDESQEQSVPPQKRARTDYLNPEDGQHFLDSNNLSLSAIQNDIAGPSSRGVYARCAAVSELQAGAIGLRRQALAASSVQQQQQMHAPVAGTSGLHLRAPAASSTPALLPRTLPQPALTRQQLNGDDLSDSSESTSGCSSLVPQGGRHDSEQQQRNSPLKQPATPPSRASSTMFEQRSLFSQTGGTSTVPQPAAASKRPAFDISALSRPSKPLSFNEKSDVTDSPFYSGKTCYGGASAYRKISPSPKMTGGISYDSIVNASLCRTPARSRGLNSSISDLISPRRIQMSPGSSATTPLALNTSQSDPSVSSVAKRILDTMDTLSSPVSDCSRIPLDDCGMGSPINKRKRLADDLYDYKSPRLSHSSGPPIRPLPVPTVHELLKMKKMQVKLQDSTEAARKQNVSQTKPLWQQSRVYSLRPDEADGSRYTNKMKRKQKNKDEEDDFQLPEEVNLPNISLTMTGLPKIDLGLSPYTPYTSRQAPSSSADHLTFTFSSPINVKDNNKTPGKNNFKIVNPSPSLGNSKPLHSVVSEPLNFNWQNNNDTSFSNIPKDTNRKASSHKSESEHSSSSSNSRQVNDLNSPASRDSAPKTTSQATKTTGSLSDMFKPAPGSWTCGTCDIRNKAEDKSCIACTTERPKALAAAKAAPVPSSTATPVPQLPLTSGFGSQFSRSGKWECDGCFNLNDSLMQKCPSCNTPNPKASSSQPPAAAPVVSSTAAASPTTAAPFFGFGDKFKKAASAWECSVCLVVNKEATATQCISCKSYKLGEGPKETSPPKTSKPLYSFGINNAKETKTETSASSNFKFGVEPDSSAKQPESAYTFGAAKPFSFGVPATPVGTTPAAAAAAPAASATSISGTSTTTLPVFGFGSQTKPEETPAKPEKKLTFPTEHAVSFLSPKSDPPSSLKRPAEPEPKSFQFASTAASTNESSKMMFPVINDNKQKESSSPIGGFAMKNDSKNEEPSSKKSSFSFSPSTPKADESSKVSPPSFMFGSAAKSPSSSSFPAAAASGPSSFVFKPAASATASAVAVSAATTPAMFNFGAPASTVVPAGPGFASSSFGAKPAEAKAPPMSFGSVAQQADTPDSVKPFAFGSAAASTFGASVNSNATPSFGSVPAPSNNPPAFGTNPTTTSSAMPMFGAVSSTNNSAPMPMFGSPSTNKVSGFGSSTTTSGMPAFGTIPPTTSVSTFGASTNSTPMFGSSASITGSSTPMFGSNAITTAPAFGAPATSAAPTSMFGAPGKSVNFSDSAKNTSLGGASPSPAHFSFGGKPQAPSNTTSAAPPAYPFNSGQGVGGFSFGSNTGAPVNSNQASSTFGFGSGSNNNATDNKSFGFGAAAPSFPSAKPAEPSSMFGSAASPGFGGAAAPTPAPAFGAAPQQFGESNNSFQTPNFGFGNAQATATPTPFGFSTAHNSNAGQNAAAPSAFMFGQQQQQQQVAAPAVPPQFNPNIRPTFNFTSGAAPAVFSATPSAQPANNSTQRRYKKAMRRIPQAPPR